MNTGMQDAFNLAWKLALASRDVAKADALLPSYSLERSAVGRKVLADAGHMTTLAVLRGRFWQGLRNHAASLIFGFAPVRHEMAVNMAELTIGYPDSPLTRAVGGRHGGPAAGTRAPVAAGVETVGAGATPRFALYASANAASAALIARFRNVLEPQVRPPFAEGGAWLVRPDGYVAVAAAADDIAAIDAYCDERFNAP